MALKDLTHLTYHKNADGEYHCPVMNKVFTEHTHIVAIKSTGNVYCWDAVDQLNIKPKNWKDLLTDEPFTRKDIIHIVDPLNLQVPSGLLGGAHGACLLCLAVGAGAACGASVR